MKKILLGAVITLLMVSLGHAETIYTKDGKTIRGKIVDVTKNSIWYEAQGGKVGIPKTSVKNIMNNDGSVSMHSPTYIEIRPSSKEEGVAEIKKDNSILTLDLPAVDLYHTIGTQISSIPYDSMPAINEVIKNGWNEDEQVKSLLVNYAEVIEMFKKATKEPNEGFLFGEKPDEIDLTTPLPNNTKNILVIKLTLAQARFFEFNRQHEKAADNYLAAARFIRQLPGQRFPAMLYSLYQAVCLNIAQPCLIDSLKNKSFSKEYYNQLLEILLSIREKQDFLEKALEEESEIMTNSARMLERGTKEEGKSIAESMSIGMLGKDLAAEDADAYNEMRKIEEEKVNMTEFFDEFYKKIDTYNNELTLLAIVAAKNNNFTEYNNKIENFKKSLEGKVKFAPIYTLKEMLLKRRSPTKIYASFMADAFLIAATPNFSKISTRYHIFYSKLNLFIAAVAVKVYENDNSKLPENLSQLQEKYYQEIPEDSFNSYKPINYKKVGTSFIVYSFGPDRKDDNARIVFAEEKTKEIGFKENISNIKGDLIISI